jgi:hypothetical protein
VDVMAWYCLDKSANTSSSDEARGVPTNGIAKAPNTHRATPGVAGDFPGASSSVVRRVSLESQFVRQSNYEIFHTYPFWSPVATPLYGESKAV